MKKKERSEKKIQSSDEKFGLFNRIATKKASKNADEKKLSRKCSKFVIRFFLCFMTVKSLVYKIYCACNATRPFQKKKKKKQNERKQRNFYNCKFFVPAIERQFFSYLRAAFITLPSFCAPLTDSAVEFRMKKKKRVNDNGFVLHRVERASMVKIHLLPLSNSMHIHMLISLCVALASSLMRRKSF